MEKQRIPTEAEIEQRAAEIRAEWDRALEIRRRVIKPVIWELPVIPTAEIAGFESETTTTH